MKFLYRVPACTFFFLSFIAFSASGQSYVSKASGNWTSGKSWNSVADACSQNSSGPVPPLSKDWGCPVDITIRHHITYPGSLTNFGNGLIAGLEIGPGGTLTVEGDFQLPAHGWGPLTYLRMGEGSSLHVFGTFSVGKADQVIIPKNSTVTLGGLIVDDNSRGIILEEGASLVVLNGTTIKA